MTRAELMGGHTHQTLIGVRVHVWRRGGRFLARGRFEGHAFGETLGSDVASATARLRQLLTELENGSFVPPSEARKRHTSRRTVPRLSLRELADEFLRAKRKARGQQTTADYAARLGPILDFAEKSSTRKRWPLAVDVDIRFVEDLRAFLYQYQTTRNGRAGGRPRPLSARQIVNILECFRTMLHWAKKAEVRKLAADWHMPLTQDLIGNPPRKDPHRQDKVPQETRIEIVRCMDIWQLCHLCLSLVLPLRPDEAVGLLVSDVDFEKRHLEFGHRFQDCNFTKAKTAFVLPFPDELCCLLRICIGDRAEGPLLRSRRAFERRHRADEIESTAHLRDLFQAAMLRQQGAVQTEQDRKLLFRRLLRNLGGTSEDGLAMELKKLLTLTGVSNGATLYTLRGSVTTAMHRARVPHLELRYLTGHAVNDILYDYVSLDATGGMQSYFQEIRPLLYAIQSRANEVGLLCGRAG
jgi:integrase